MYFYSLNWLWCINATISCVYIWKHGASGFYCSHLNFRICKLRSCTISVGPAENYWVQDLHICILIFFFKKSVAVGNWESLSSIIHTIPHLTITVAVSTLSIFYAIQHISHNSSFNTGTSHTVSHLIVTQTSSVV